MKKVLIISPYFPPCNTADMQRVRMSLPYFEQLNWKAEVVTVNPKHIDIVKDQLLMEHIPNDIKIHQVKALSKKWTSKIGLGSIALRSLWFYRRKINQLLKKEKFDLIYFSTTQFPVLILGAYWKKKYKIPYVIDMQDPWHSDYYLNKPKNERPHKYWFSYYLNKYLEPIAIKKVDGLISVSQAYIDVLAKRYPHLKNIPKEVITFGTFKPDFELVKSNYKLFSNAYQKEEGSFNFVYVGRGGHDMKVALVLLFSAFKIGLKEMPEVFNKIRFHFIGTSYAPKGKGIPTIKPLADEMGLARYVNEQTDRIPFYQSIYTLLKADALLIIGSDDPQYTASKIYPYILAEKPLLAFFHPNSSAAQIINECNAGEVLSLQQNENQIPTNHIYQKFKNIVIGGGSTKIDWEKFEYYSAKNMTKLQCELFDKVINLALPISNNNHFYK